MNDEVTIYLFLDHGRESKRALEEVLRAAEIAEKEYRISVRVLPVYVTDIIDKLPRIHVESLIVSVGRYASVNEILDSIIDAISAKDFSESIFSLPAVASTYLPSISR